MNRVNYRNNNSIHLHHMARNSSFMDIDSDDAEMLLGRSSSGSMLDDACNHDSEDELLEDPFDAENPILTSTLIAREPEESMKDANNHRDTECCRNGLDLALPKRYRFALPQCPPS